MQRITFPDGPPKLSELIVAIINGGTNASKTLHLEKLFHSLQIYIEMKSADGIIFHMKGNFIKIIHQEQLIFTFSAFENEEGRPQWKIIMSSILYQSIMPLN